MAREWRRYAVSFELPADGAPWYRLEVDAEGAEGSLWIDAVQLDEGEAADYRPRVELSVSVADGRRLRRAGEAATFTIRLRRPGGGETPLTWWLEDGFGQPLRRGRELLVAPERGEVSTSVRFSHLGRGAYRLVAEAEVGDEAVVEDATVAVVTWELGGPEPWFGAQYAAGRAGQAALELLRIGIHRGVVGPSLEPPAPGVERAIIGYQRAGITSFGILPEPDGDAEAYGEACRLAAARTGGRVKTWEAPELSAEHRRAAWEGLQSANRRSLLLAAAIDADGGLGRLRELADEGLPAATSALVIDLPAVPPERLGGVGLEQLIGAARDLCGEMPIAVRSAGLVAGPWDRSLPAGPGETLDPPTQAAWLVRSILMARAAGAACFLYPGAPQGDRDATLTVAGRTADLYDCTGAPLPAVAALDQVLDETRDRRLAERIELGRGAVCYRWQGRRPLATVWQTWRGDGPARLIIPLPPADLNARDLFGRPILLAGDPHTVLPLGAQPVFLEANRLGYREFAAALRAAELRGVPQVEAAFIPAGRGVALLLRNVGNRPAAGTVSRGEEELGFGPVAPGEQVALPWLERLQPVMSLAAQVRSGDGDEPIGHHVVCAGGDELIRPDRLAGGLAPGPDGRLARGGLTVTGEGLLIDLAVDDDLVTDGDVIELLVDTDLLGDRFEGVWSNDDHRFEFALTAAEPPGLRRLVTWRELGLDGPPAALGIDLGWHDVDAGGVLTRHLRWTGSTTGDRDPRALGWWVRDRPDGE